LIGQKYKNGTNQVLIKEKDSIEHQIELLESLQKQNLSPGQKKSVDTEIKILRSGIKGENTSAYFLDFHFGESKNWAILHDFRIEHNGQVAQIDHLLINRFLEFYVLESKNYSNGMKITDDAEFLIYFGGRTKAVESPIEQNERHIYLLQKFFKSNTDLLPKRLGLRIKPSFKNYVIVSPQSKVTRPKKTIFDTSSVIKSDALYSLIKKQNDEASFKDVVTISKVIGQDTLKNLAESLVPFHKPAPLTNYQKKFGIDVTQAEPDKTKISTKSTGLDSTQDELVSENIITQCPRCGSELLERVAKKGVNAGNKFMGCSAFPKCRFTQAI
jgi:hypothetical protein